MTIDISVTKDCLNHEHSYGVICVRCNSCGRFNESKYSKFYNLVEWEEFQKLKIKEARHWWKYHAKGGETE